jgi:fatty acid desaturase
MEKIVKNLAERAAREDHEKKIEALIKVQAAIFDKAAAYTNLVIVAGYAAFYAVWSKSEAYLPGTWFVLCALLVTFSALTFICFEVFKSLINREAFKA